MKEPFNNSSSPSYLFDVSIIIPVHNGSGTLERCLNTLLTKSEISQEIILVNDFSTDNSEEIIDSYIQKYPNIKLINSDHNMARD